MANKRKAVSVYMTEAEKEMINTVKLPTTNSFSQKVIYLVNKGASHIKQEHKTSTNTITYIDLFSGLGGIRIGFEQALNDLGFQGKALFSSDIKDAAIQAYKENFNEDSSCDITKVNPKELPDFDFLLGGFPCQAFSQAGLGLGFDDTRGTLFFDIANILKVKRPSGFVLENVEGLVNHDKGKTFKVIQSTLKELGYQISYAVLDGKDFGLAQSRKRIYIIGLKGKSVQALDNFEKRSSVLGDIIERDVPSEKTEFTKKLLSHFKLEELYGKAIKDKRGGDNNIHSWEIGLKGEITEEQKELLKLLLRSRRSKKWADIIGIDWMDGMPLTESMIRTFYDHPNLKRMLDNLVEKGYLVLEHPKQRVNNRRIPDKNLPKGYNIVSGKLSFEFSKILDPNDITPTLVATDVHKLAVPVKDGLRKLTINEGLRLFGFPEDYSLDKLPYTQAFDLLGNTVCIPVIKEVSKKLLESYSQ